MARSGADFHVSNHAIQRALEMGVSGQEIRDCFDNPTDSFFSKKHGGETRIKGRLSLGLRFDWDMRMYVITTVLWATQEAWEADYARGSTQDRQPRRDMNHLKRTANDG